MADDGGYDLHEAQADVHAGEHGYEHQLDQDQSLHALEADDHQETHLHFAHGSEVHEETPYHEYDAKEYTELSEDSESDSHVQAVEYNNSLHEETSEEIREFEERIHELQAHEGGYEGGEIHELHEAPEHYEPHEQYEDKEPDYAPDVKR
jgi:hypothetical protein